MYICYDEITIGIGIGGYDMKMDGIVWYIDDGGCIDASMDIELSIII